MNRKTERFFLIIASGAVVCATGFVAYHAGKMIGAGQPADAIRAEHVVNSAKCAELRIFCNLKVINGNAFAYSSAGLCQNAENMAKFNTDKCFSYATFDANKVYPLADEAAK